MPVPRWSLCWGCRDVGPCSRHRGDMPLGLQSSIILLASALGPSFQLGISSNHPNQQFVSSKLLAVGTQQGSNLLPKQYRPWITHGHGQKEQSHEQMLAELPCMLLDPVYRLFQALIVCSGTGCQLTHPFQQTAAK